MSCILYQNSSSTITILDIPRSISEAQGLSDSPELISSKLLNIPYPSMEPKSAKAKLAIVPVSLQDLLLQKHLEFALAEVKADYKGPWYFPRATSEISHVGRLDAEGKGCRKRVRERVEVEPLAKKSADDIRGQENHIYPEHFFHNSAPKSLRAGHPDREEILIPPNSTFLQGDISETVAMFKVKAPKFDIIVLDPPWPNRSARRKKEYSISYGNSEIRALLSSIPLYDHLADNGNVAVWITNKPSFRDMVVGDGGLFEQWDVQLVEEWIWLKVTGNGEPICALDSTWRKPYEGLLVGRRGGSGDVMKKLLIGVPDLHSRKPNLKALFETTTGNGIQGLEIFARNLTAGWWSWGNEVLKFQTSEHWTP